MGKEKKSGAVDVKFTVPAFRHKGVEYKSADVEKAVEAGDEDAIKLVAKLVEMKSGVVDFAPAEEEAPPVAPKAPKQPKAPKAPKAAKNKKLKGGTHE